jgi:hypothetical protein
MGEYVPQAPVNDEAKKHNQNLPGMGGVFNTVNLHVYAYTHNNPVNLTDPDGETPASRKEREGRYTFHPAISTLDKAVVNATGFIPKVNFAMGTMVKGIDKLFGYKTIDGATMKDAIMKYTGGASDIASGLGTATELIGGAIKAIGKKLNIFADFLTGLNVILAMSEGDQIYMDHLISEFFGGKTLTANSHEGVAFLYAHALARMAELVKSGDLSFETDIMGSAKSARLPRTDTINKIREELVKLKSDKGLDPL